MRKERVRYISLIVILSLLSACSYKKNKDLQILDSTDFSKSCVELNLMLENLIVKKRRLVNRKHFNSAKNITLYVLALPTAFLSLLFLDSSDESNDELYVLERRVEHLKDLEGMKNCVSDTNLTPRQ